MLSRGDVVTLEGMTDYGRTIVRFHGRLWRVRSAVTRVPCFDGLPFTVCRSGHRLTPLEGDDYNGRSVWIEYPYDGDFEVRKIG